MVYDKIIQGKFVDLKSITLEDAEFSYDIRVDEKHCKIVGQPAASVSEQRKFIEWQMKQPGDYYFVVYNKKNERIGLLGVYNIHNGIGEVGREVSYGNPMETMEALVLLEDFICDVLKLERLCYVIYTQNGKNISNQKKKGYLPQRIIYRNGIECAYYEVPARNNANNKIRKLLKKINAE